MELVRRRDPAGVGPSYDDVHYESTRAFYDARGFVAIHEFDRIDWDGPTLLLVKALGPPDGGRGVGRRASAAD